MVEELVTSSISLQSIQADFQTGIINALAVVNTANNESQVKIQAFLSQTTEVTQVTDFSPTRTTQVCAMRLCNSPVVYATTHTMTVAEGSGQFSLKLLLAPMFISMPAVEIHAIYVNEFVFVM